MRAKTGSYEVTINFKFQISNLKSRYSAFQKFNQNFGEGKENEQLKDDFTRHKKLFS